MRAAIVGCGGIAQVHAKCIADLPELTLVCVADIKPERAKALAKQYGVSAYTSLEQMLENEKFDVLHICTPHYLHVPMAELAASKGIAVFTEKPPAITGEQWERLKSAARKIPLGICFQNRYNESTAYMKKLADSEDFGKIKGARAFVTWSRDAAYYTESGWRGSPETEGGGVLINQAIHTMDLLVYLVGTPKGVEASAANRHLKETITVEDTLEAYINFEGKSALFYATTAHCTDAPVMLEICFEGLTARIEENEITLIYADGRKEYKYLGKRAEGEKAYWGIGHLRCIEDFYRALKAGEPAPISVDSVENTVGLMLAVYQSAKEGRYIVF